MCACLRGLGGAKGLRLGELSADATEFGTEATDLSMLSLRSLNALGKGLLLRKQLLSKFPNRFHVHCLLSLFIVLQRVDSLSNFADGLNQVLYPLLHLRGRAGSRAGSSEHGLPAA